MDTIRVLVVDDNEGDFALIRAHLQDIEYPVYTVEWASNFESGRQTIKSARHDVYLVDYRLGAKDGVALIRDAVAAGCDAPILLLTGERSREVDREAMEAGAVDYLVKDGVSPDSLERAIRYGIREKRTLRELRAAVEQLNHLRGIIPICMYCNRLRGDKDYWQQVDVYLEKYAGASLSHGICPSCWKETVVPQLEELGCEDLEY